MFQRISKVAGFVTVAMLPAASNLILTLILVRSLPIDGFAEWAIIEPTLLIFATLAALGMQYGVLYTTAADHARPQRALGIALTLALPVAAIGGFAAAMAARIFLPNISIHSLMLPLVADTLAVICISSLRGQKRLTMWILFEGVRSFGFMAVTLLLFLQASPLAASIDSLLLIRGTMTLMAVIAVAVLMRAELGFDRTLTVRMLKYGLPISLASVVSLTTSSGDRFLLAAFHVDHALIASYAAHQRLTGMMTVLTVTPLNLWFAVEAMKRNTAEHQLFYRGVVIMVLALLSVLLAGAFLFGPLLWPLFFPGIQFVPIVFGLLALALIPQALGIVLNIGGLREKNTHLNVIMVGVTSATVLALGVPLIQIISIIGAATARLGAFVVSSTSGRLLSQRIAPVHHPLVPLLPFVAAIAAGAATLAFPPLHPIALGLDVVVLALVGTGLFFSRQTLKTLLGKSEGVTPVPAGDVTAKDQSARGALDTLEAPRP